MKLCNIIIREIIQNDYEKLREIFYRIRTEEFAWAKDVKLADFDSTTEGEIVFTALVDDNVAGFISVWQADKFIHNLFVSKEYRKYGIGKALINKALLTFGTPLTLKCVKENQNSANFYLANGWVIEKEEIGSEGAYYLMSYDCSPIS